ncbi:MAG TPA: CRISPR-associated endonuclease Cas3'', partial [Synergistaceae bacterium]|nr:CRISPR-associated endonuclease Cas3'' [Synergistaceae bacterium]
METPQEPIAHVKGNAREGWVPQPLGEHLEATARIAGEFAAAFGNRDWGELLGFWHDLGKFVPDWQMHIRKGSGYDADAHIETYGGRVNHSSAGAVLAFERLKGHPVARAL